MKLHNQVTIKQTITPATIQLLEMVQMNTTELSSYLTEQAMENPAIDIDELGSAAKAASFPTRSSGSVHLAATGVNKTSPATTTRSTVR